MFLENYYRSNGASISFTRQQASDFAKGVADDFNPIHDVDAKRFCVPGDLLFSVTLARAGVSQRMHFTFSGMVGEGIELTVSDPTDGVVTLRDERGKEYLSVRVDGDISNDENMAAGLARNYVAFSGHTFPHILVPLLAKQQVMINPDRPLVIYESMEIDLDTLDFSDPSLALSDSQLDLGGKRGKVCLAFDINAGGETVGRGRKNMLISGLLPYDEESANRLVDDYAARKQNVAARPVSTA